jgi:hypothetical protein
MGQGEEIICGDAFYVGYLDIIGLIVNAFAVLIVLGVKKALIVVIVVFQVKMGRENNGLSLWSPL